MNFSKLSKKVDDLSVKLADEPKECIGRFDNSSFSEAEKVLFRKFEELQEEYGTPLPNDILKANMNLVSKANEVIFRYALGTFRFTVLCHLGNPENKIDTFYFNLHFHKFLVGLKDALKNVHEWPESERKDLDEFLDKKVRADSFGAENASCNLTPEKKPEYIEDDDNEHYDRV